MADTLPDITFQKGVWVDVYTLSGITLGNQVVVFNKGSYPLLLVSSVTSPVSDVNGTPLYVNSNIVMAASSSKLWAYCGSGTGLLSVQDATSFKFKNGALLTTSAHTLGMSFSHAVSLNLVPGVRRVVALGNNQDIDTSTSPEDIVPAGGLYPWPTTAVTLRISSSSPEDASAGTGARTVLISGLNNLYNEQSEVITLNGTTNVLSTNQYLRVNGVTLMSAGSGKINAGDVSFLNDTNSDVLARMPVGRGVGKNSNYTVPAGYTLCINSVFIGINRPSTQTDATVATYFGSPNGFYRLPLEISMTGVPYRHDSDPPIMVLEKNDFVLRGMYVNQNNSDITGAWNGTLYQNSAVTAV